MRRPEILVLNEDNALLAQLVENSRLFLRLDTLRGVAEWFLRGWIALLPVLWLHSSEVERRVYTLQVEMAEFSGATKIQIPTRRRGFNSLHPYQSGRKL